MQIIKKIILIGKSMKKKYFLILNEYFKKIDKNNSGVFNENMANIIIKLLKNNFADKTILLKVDHENAKKLINDIRSISIKTSSEIFLQSLIRVVENHCIVCFKNHIFNVKSNYFNCMESITAFVQARLTELKANKISFTNQVLTSGSRLNSVGRFTDEYLAIRDNINFCIQNLPVTAPYREDARLEKAKKICNDPKSSEAAKKNAARRLLENKKDILPPRSAPIHIQHIFKNENLALQDIYDDHKEKFKKIVMPNSILEKEIEKNLNRISFVNKNQMVLNSSLAEVYLWHGISARSYLRTLQNGFRPDLGGNYGTEKKPLYGYSGQGTYLTDNFSKMMSYSSCSNCGDFECDCINANGKKFPRYAILAKCLLGNVYHRRLSHIFDLINHIKIRKQTFDELPRNFHSIYVAGKDATYNPLKLGNSANEFLIKRYQQMFPSYLVAFELA